MKRQILYAVLLALVALGLTGCSAIGGAVAGTGNMISKTGRGITNLAN
ncbi:MAG: hypothetical protein K1X53_00750 [Candidatus Sumerlaeaceae bacterium]|nr:hypothetical protein [Candidatus Sumerlaeaceae bacterium]